MVPIGPVEGAGFKAPWKPSGGAASRGSGLCVLSAYPVSTAAKRPHTRWGAGAVTEAFIRWNSDFSEDNSVSRGTRTCTSVVAWKYSSDAQGDPLEEGMETHSSILAWRIPWTEKLGVL